MQLVKFVAVAISVGCEAWTVPTVTELSKECNPDSDRPMPQCAAAVARAIVVHSKECFDGSSDEASYGSCARNFCGRQCGNSKAECQSICVDHSLPLFAKFAARAHPAPSTAPSTTAAPSTTSTSEPTASKAPDSPVDEEQIVNEGSFAQMDSRQLMSQAREAAGEEAAAMSDLQAAQERMRRLNAKIKVRGEKDIRSGNTAHGRAELEKVSLLSSLNDQIDQHLANVAQFRSMARSEAGSSEAEPVPDMSQGLPPMEQPSFSFLQRASRNART